MRLDKRFGVICTECSLEVESRDDLVTAFRWVIVKPMHAACYAKSLRGFRSLIVNNYPINGAMFMFNAVLSAAVGLFIILPMLITIHHVSKSAIDAIPGFLLLLVLLALFSTPMLIRYYSWARYEKELP